MKFKNLFFYYTKRHNKKSFIFIIIAGILYALLEKNLVDPNLKSSMFLGDYILNMYKGVTFQELLKVGLSGYLITIFPHILIFYFSEIYFTNALMDTPKNLFIRLKSKRNWYRSLEISTIYIIIKYYVVFYLSNIIGFLIFSSVKIGDINSTFNLKINELALVDSKQVNIMVIILLLNILTMIGIILTANTLYFVFHRKDLVIIITFMVNIMLMLFGDLGKFINILIPMNHLTLVRHSLFLSGASYLTVKLSLIYTVIVIAINLILAANILKKQDF